MPVASKPTPRLEPGSQKWLVQIRRGELRLINDLAELIRLVLERRVERNSLLYRITEEPRVISDVPELAELFDSPLTPPPQAAMGRDVSGTFDPDSDEVPDLESISPLGSTADAFADDYYEVPRSRWPGALLAIVGLAAVGGGGYFALRHAGSGSTSAPLAAVPAPAPAPVTLPPPVAATPEPTPAPTPPPAAAPAPAPAPEPVAAAAPAPEPSPPPAAVVAKPEPTPPPVAQTPPQPRELPPPAAEVAKPKAAAHAQAMHPAPSRPEPRPEPARPAAGPRSYDSLIREGDRLIESGKTKKAMALFEEASKLRPDGVAALTGMGYGWLDRGDAKRAASMFQQAMLKDNRHAPALFGLGEAYRELGRKTEAVTAFRLYLSRFPNNRDASAARRQIEQLGGK